MMKFLPALMLAVGLTLAWPLLAKDNSEAKIPPRWEQLTEAQRQVLIQGLREHWDNEPDGRARKLERAERWARMTPQQREQARMGISRYERMTPAEREEARAVFEYTREMNKEERRNFRNQWQKMTPDQRKTWVNAHPPSRKNGRGRE